MLRATVAVLLATVSTARADLRPCAEKAVAAAPEKDRKDLQHALADKPAPRDWTAAAKKALADTYDPVDQLSFVVESAALAGDRKATVELVDQMEAAAKANPPKYDFNIWRREVKLAQAEARAGRAKEARAHVAAANAHLPESGHAGLTSAHAELMTTALELGDDKLATSEEAAFFAALKQHPDSSDVLVHARFIAYAGFGRRVLPWADKGDKDRVLGAILEGVKATKDLPLAIEIVGKLSPRSRLSELEQLWIRLDAADKYSPAFVATVKASLAVEQQGGVDDFARGELVEVLADIGLATEAKDVASRIGNTWARANGEARAAQALALVDRKAAVALARAAVKRAATPGFRTSVDNDKFEIEAARGAATSALARSGELAEAKKLGKPSAIDVAIGLRDKPAELAAYWKTVAPTDRAWVLIAGARGWHQIGDATFLAALCGE